MPGRRNPPAKWVLPSVIYPPGRRCFVISVPDERQYVAAFRGALWNLCSGMQWQDDPLHKARLVAQVWRGVYEAVYEIDCNPVLPETIAEMEYQMSVCEQLRFQDGKLQGLCCGTWEDITGQGGLPVGGQPQPGTGNPAPTAGNCHKYHAEMAGNSNWYLPAVVNAGDVLTFSNPQGACDDGSLGPLSPWFCPDGGQFFAGINSGGKRHNVGDPTAGFFHMQLMTLIAGVYYDASQGTVTVPGGVVNSPVVLVVNDQTLSDNSGNYSVDIEYCNNNTAAVTWVVDLDMTIAPHGIAANAQSFWTAGVGWQANALAAGYWAPRVSVVPSFQCHITGLAFEYSNPQTPVANEATVDSYSVYPAHLFTYQDTLGAGSTVVDRNTGILPGDSPNAGQLDMAIDTAAAFGTGTISRITIYGDGPQPIFP